MKFGIGQPVRRVEDARLLSGAGRYTDDIVLPRQAYAYFLRSPHAHADIARIDTAAARSAPGVRAVIVGPDLAAAGVKPIPCTAPVVNRDGSTTPLAHRPAIAQGRVRYVGEIVAMVVAEGLAEAKDAAELIEVDYRPLPAVVDTAGALEAGAPQIWDFAPGNVVFDWTKGDERATTAAFDKAAHKVSIELVNNRVIPSSLEPRNAIGDYSAHDGRLTLYCSSQGGHSIKKLLAADVFKVPVAKLRVVTPDVGGGFGMKLFTYPEYVAVLFAARALKRPVKWTGERGEAFLADTHGRDHVTRAELALDRNGKFLAMRVNTIANLGAYLSNYGPFIPTDAGTAMLAGVYTTPAIFVEVRGAYTNTAPIDAYRGAGRPEANYATERLVDLAAHQLSIAPDELRRRNFIPPTAMPYKTALDAVYDSGDFARNMQDAMKAAEWAGFPARRDEAASRGKLRGIGLATYIEACGGGPDESATIRFDPSGGVAVFVGNQSNGQGHETFYAQLAADKLGVPFESVRVVQGDTDQIVYGNVTGGSRALSVGGTALITAADRVIAKGKKLAAHLLEAAENDIEFRDGRFVIAGTDRGKTIIEIAKASFDMAKLPGELSPGLEDSANFLSAASTYPNGCHIAEVEIDPETGRLAFVRYTVVDDFGRVVNPLTLAGQVHGGSAQGIGQALLEACVYDHASGQLLTGSFMDYALPRASDVPTFNFAYNEIPCTANPLGVKGAGEAGAIGAPPAVINAVLDALWSLGVRRIDMPATPERIWQAIQAARTRQAAE